MKTISRVYDTYGQARQVVEERKSAGIPDARISLVANKHVSAEYDDVDDASGAATGVGIGATIGGAGGLLAGLGMIAIPGIGPVVAAGALATTLGGAAVGAVAGGILGALVGAGIPEDDARRYETHVSEGRILITAQATSARQAEEARDAFDRFGGSDVRAYDRSAATNAARS